MSTRADTLKRLRSAMIAAALIGAVAAAMIWRAQDRWTAHRALIEQADRRDHRLLSEVRHLERDLRIARSHDAMFSRLAGTGVIGEFSKTKALDRFEAIAGQFGDRVQNWSLAARRPLGADFPGLSQYALGRQGLRFDASLYHGAEFLALWRSLSQGAGGLSSIDECRLIRTANSQRVGGVANAGESVPGGANAAPVPMLRINCALSWFSFHVPDAAVVAESSLGAAPPPPPEADR